MSLVFTREIKKLKRPLYQLIQFLRGFQLCHFCILIQYQNWLNKIELTHEIPNSHYIEGWSDNPHCIGGGGWNMNFVSYTTLL